MEGNDVILAIADALCSRLGLGVRKGTRSEYRHEHADGCCICTNNTHFSGSKYVASLANRNGKAVLSYWTKNIREQLIPKVTAIPLSDPDLLLKMEAILHDAYHTRLINDYEAKD